jgi:hypothetical protein
MLGDCQDKFKIFLLFKVWNCNMFWELRGSFVINLSLYADLRDVLFYH